MSGRTLSRPETSQRQSCDVYQASCGCFVFLSPEQSNLAVFFRFQLSLRLNIHCRLFLFLANQVSTLKYRSRAQNNHGKIIGYV